MTAPKAVRAWAFLHGEDISLTNLNTHKSALEQMLASRDFGDSKIIEVEIMPVEQVEAMRVIIEEVWALQENGSKKHLKHYNNLTQPKE